MIRRREPYNTERARQLRADQTPPEGVFWSRVRGRRLGGLRFRRQHSIGPLVVDFACPEAMVVVELDSSYHDGRQEADAGRDALLAARGWCVVRVSAGELARDERAVLERVLRVCRKRVEVMGKKGGDGGGGEARDRRQRMRREGRVGSPSPRPSPPGGEGGRGDPGS